MTMPSRNRIKLETRSETVNQYKKHEYCLRLLTVIESKWSLLIIFPSITNIVRVKIPATTCLKSRPISVKL